MAASCIDICIYKNRTFDPPKRLQSDKVFVRSNVRPNVRQTPHQAWLAGLSDKTDMVGQGFFVRVLHSVGQIGHTPLGVSDLSDRTTCVN